MSNVLQYLCHGREMYCLNGMLSQPCALRRRIACLTFPCSSAPYGAFSSAPLNAPSLSPPLCSCRICPESVCTSCVDAGTTAGVSVVRSKLEEDSGSSLSMSIVRQLKSAIFADRCVLECVSNRAWLYVNVKRVDKSCLPHRNPTQMRASPKQMHVHEA